MDWNRFNACIDVRPSHLSSLISRRVASNRIELTFVSFLLSQSCQAQFAPPGEEKYTYSPPTATEAPPPPAEMTPPPGEGEAATKTHIVIGESSSCSLLPLLSRQN